VPLGDGRPGRRAVAWTAAWLTAIAASPALVPARGAGPLAVETVTFRTVPAVPGVRVRSMGRIATTDSQGRVTLAVERTGRRLRSIGAPEVLATRLRSGAQARFGGLFESRRTLGISLYARTRLRFVDRDGRPFPTRRVGTVRLRSSTGARVAVKGALTPRLQASRVVIAGGAVRSRPITYAVESVRAGGGEVVNRAQLRFSPLRTRRLRVPLLLFSARFTARDALFGSPAGSAMTLEYPDGHVVRMPLREGNASASDLPRGQYTVRVEAPGYSVERPVWLSRDLVVPLQVVSPLDLVVILGGLASVALGLVLAGRPLLRRRLRRVPGRRGVSARR
jgi:hypothetical protein